jgi:hypothetical protein
MSIILQEFFMFPEEIYRIGNSGSMLSRRQNARPH